MASYPTFLPLALVAGGGWALAVVRDRGGLGGGVRREVALLLIAGGAVRALLLLPETPLSDDLYRYLWDGHVANHGVNPYAHAPQSPELDALDTGVRALVNHPSIPTIYPPVAQWLFRGLDAVGAGPGGVRALFAALDLAAAAFLALLLGMRGRNPRVAVVYALCPLAALESAAGGHVDPAGIALMTAGLTAWAASRIPAAGLLLGAAVLVKPMPLFLFPALLIRLCPRDRARFAFFAALPLLLYLPHLDAGFGVFGGLEAYAARWSSHGALFPLGEWAGIPAAPLRVILATAAVALSGIFAWRIRDPLAAGACAVGAALVLTPTAHPWYLVWLVPLLPFLPRAVLPAGIALIALAPVSYAAGWLFACTGVWAEPVATRWILWGSVVLALALGFLRVRKDAFEAPPPERSPRESSGRRGAFPISFR
ncbi:MAG: hypothetical protein QF819_02190 [Gemmatimonadota bacterium]|nr:hypothetical protein [Gemmatimonadota bacterium]MDP7031317.1 hypothetical protein [Gemmatimonadota bacterium]